MEERVLNEAVIHRFSEHLRLEERSIATREKYLRDVRRFLNYVETRSITKDVVIAWKKELIQCGYAVRSINSMLASLNSLLEFLGWTSCKVRNIRMQQSSYCEFETQLTKAEYLRLLEASKTDVRLNLILQTICGTGIRVSELRFFTVEALTCGRILVECKSKIRTILIPKQLKKLLLNYAKQNKLSSGPIFLNKKNKPLDRSTIWRMMKRLCTMAKISDRKVFPHNLRKLFARTFYRLEKDIAKLADILGHSSINTTRIYIISTGLEHQSSIDRMGLIMSKTKTIT